MQGRGKIWGREKIKGKTSGLVRGGERSFRHYQGSLNSVNYLIR